MNRTTAIIAIALLFNSTSRSEVDISEIINTPREISLGMTESSLADQKPGLFPGLSPTSESGKPSFKTFMEVVGMGLPGFQSFNYLYEEDKLQGVIQTTSLIGLGEDEAIRISATNYKRILEHASGSPQVSEIFRMDDESGGISKVTLETWSIDNGSIDVFHVATNYESSVGILSRDSKFPTGHLFISADDERFKDLTSDEATIIDTSREALLNPTGLPVGNQQEDGAELGPSDQQFDIGHRGRGKDSGSPSSAQGSNSVAPPLFVWILIIFSFLGILYVFWKLRRTRG